MNPKNISAFIILVLLALLALTFFSQTLDIRGVRAEEAIGKVEDYIDEALLLGHTEVKNIILILLAVLTSSFSSSGFLNVPNSLTS